MKRTSFKPLTSYCPSYSMQQSLLTSTVPMSFKNILLIYREISENITDYWIFSSSPFIFFSSCERGKRDTLLLDRYTTPHYILGAVTPISYL